MPSLRSQLVLIFSSVLIISMALLQPQQLAIGQPLDIDLYLPVVVKNYPLITKIAFSSERDGNPELYVLTSTGTNLTRLTNNSADDFGQRWSPNGMQLVYISDQDGNSEIYKVNVDGSFPTRLTNNTSFESNPSWSPDGLKIAFLTNRHGSSNLEIYIMNSDGSGETRLTNNTTNDRSPEWSPDSSQLAFVGGGEIYVINSDGTAPSPITSISDVYAYNIDWSPDGTRLVFRGEVGSNQEIFVVNIDSTGLANITNDPGVDLSPTWSPTGERLVFSCNFMLCVMNPDGSNLIELTENVDLYPTWSPDGKEIVFSSARDGNSEIYTINVDGTGLQRLTNNPETDWRPIWQP